MPVASWHPLLLFLAFSLTDAQPQFGLNLPQPAAVQVLPQQQPAFPTFPVLQGVPQMPLAVHPLQPFGLQPFQPQPVQVVPQPNLQAQPFPGIPQPNVQTQPFPGVQGVQGVQTFSPGGLPTFPTAVQPQLNPFNPFALPGFQLPPQNYQPFPGVMNVSPLYSTNQGGQPAVGQPVQQQTVQQPYQQPTPANQPTLTAQTQQVVQPQVQPAARPQFEVPQGVQLQQETDSVRVAPVLRARATPPPTTRPAPTVPPTTPAPTPEPSTLMIVDARSESKPAKKSTTTLPLEISSEEDNEEDIDDNIPPEVPKELTEMRRRLDEEEERIEETTKELAEMKRRLEEEEKLIQQTTALAPTRTRDRWASIRTGSATPKVIDFRSISQPKMTTPGPQGGGDAAARNDQEIEAILGRVLDAVAPMHGVAASSSEIEFRRKKA